MHTTSSLNFPTDTTRSSESAVCACRGGERQRISLARAFLKDAPILILDEPTSSVDVETEAAIMDTMQRLMKGKTALMVRPQAQYVATV